MSLDFAFELILLVVFANLITWGIIGWLGDVLGVEDDGPE